MTAAVRIFIGSGEASRVERKVLIHSLRKYSRRELSISVFNGTHNTVEPAEGEPVLAPMSIKAKYLNHTEFSNYRFLIPQLCGHQGRAIWLDSDMVALSEIGELFDAPMNGADFLAKPEAYGRGADERWGLSAALFDCERCRFDLELYVSEIEAGLYGYTDLHQMTSAFLARHPFTIGRLDPDWNVFDHRDSTTKLIHYTNLTSQPWKFPGHRFGQVWFDHLAEARASGTVADRDIELSQARGYVRQDLLKGNRPGGIRTRLRHLVDAFRP